MNWSDLLVAGIILGFGIIGLINGFVYSIFRLASFFLSIVISVKFYPFVAKVLMKTALYANIKQSIFKSLMLQQSQAPKIGSQAKQAAAEAVVNNLRLPGFMKDMIKAQMPDPAKFLDIAGIINFVSEKIATFAIEVISLVLLYILVRIALIFLRFVLQGVAKLPLFKQVDRLGGFAFGAVEGLLTVYIVFAAAVLFNAAPQFKGFFEAVDSSVVAKFFYQNNFIIDWMLPGR